MKVKPKAKDGAGAPPANVRTSPWLAVLFGLGWTAGASIARVIGMWPALAGTAVGLGALALALEWDLLRKLMKSGGVPSFASILAGLLVGTVMIAATYLLYPLLTRVAPGIGRDVANLYANLAAIPRIGLALALVPVVVGEEIVWRGVVQGVLVRRFRPEAAALLAALAYAVAQSPLGSPVLVGVAFACGLTWGGLRAATGSLIAPIVAHVLWDEIVVLFAPLPSGG